MKKGPSEYFLESFMNQSNSCGNSQYENLIYALSTLLLHRIFRYTMENNNLTNSNMQLLFAKDRHRRVDNVAS